jgi:hypothetical protein
MLGRLKLEANNFENICVDIDLCADQDRQPRARGFLGLGKAFVYL